MERTAYRDKAGATSAHKDWRIRAAT